MSKRYYTDPLAAAWMVSRYGMKLHFPDGDMPILQIDMSGQAYFQYPATDARDKIWEGHFKIFVHPDSLHLLEPQVGDIMDYFRPDTAMTMMQHWYEKYYPLKHLDQINGNDCAFNIIQRNGTAFMWPKVEE